MKASVSRRIRESFRRAWSGFCGMAADIGETALYDPLAIPWACVRAALVVLLFMPLAGFLIGSFLFLLEAAPGLVPLLAFVPVAVYFAARA